MTGIDVKKALQQHLQSLHWAGLSGVPNSGELEFDFTDLAIDADESDPAENAPPRLSGKALAADTPPKESQSVSNAADRFSRKTSHSPETADDATAKPAAIALTSPAADQPALKQQGDYGPPVGDADARQSALAVIENEVSACMKCPELCGARQNTVFGVGPADAKIVFLGEGPDATEDERGEPFVGAAGQLLDKILGASTLDRKQVYIVNVVKCRPPGNRNPAETEVANCWNYLERQLDVIQPTHIVCLGSVAAKSLLETKSSLGKLRKRFHQYRGSKVVVTYHPAYLLRTPSAKKNVWEDMKMLMSDLGVEL